MLSLFNPWVILGVLMAVLGAFGGGYYKGGEDENARQQAEIASLNAVAREKEQALVSAVTKTATQLVKVNNNAKIEIAKRDAAIASGALRLRVPIQATCPVPTPVDAPAPSGNSVQATAELDPAFAQRIISITDQGDANTRQLNACIDAYNTAFQAINQRSKP
jgi:prophage endopeptidase